MIVLECDMKREQMVLLMIWQNGLMIILLKLGQQLQTSKPIFMKLLKSKTPQLATISDSIDSPLKYSEKSEMQLPLSPEIKSIIRRKVSSYLSYHITTTSLSKQLTTIKKSKPLLREFPEYSNLMEFLKGEKTVFHLYKEKIDRSMDECLYFYLKILCLAIDYQCRISAKEIDYQSSVMIDAFLFVASSLFEAGAEKAAYYFATIAITFCEYYKVLQPIGEFLLIMAKISRKLFKYKESILLLKKALEYNWWCDPKRVDLLTAHFRKWMSETSPDQLETFDQKFEIARVFSVGNCLPSHRTQRIDSQLKVLRDLFHQFSQSSRMKHEDMVYDVILKRQRIGSRKKIGLQLQIYNEMSFSFLQLNKKEESKLFAEKYQSGYTEPQDSNIILLSHELINSVQKRVSGWNQIGLKNFELLFFVDIFAIVVNQRSRMRNMEQEVIMESFNFIFESISDNFVTKDMFNYEIPLPLELRKDMRSKKHSDTKKFIIRQRSSSHTAKQNVQVLKKYSSDKVEENLIFNYRGLKISRLKLLDIYGRLVDSIDEKERQGSFKHVSWK